MLLTHALHALLTFHYIMNDWNTKRNITKVLADALELTDRLTAPQRLTRGPKALVTSSQDHGTKTYGVTLGSAAVRTEHLRTVSEEASTNQWRSTTVTDETFTMPMSVIKRNKLSPTKTGNWLETATALLGEQFAETVSTVWLLITWRELLTSQNLVTVSACKTLPVPWSVLVSNASLVDHPIALHTSLCILLLIALDTDNFLVTRYKALVSNWLQAYLAAETLFVPLFAFVLIFLHSCSEESTTSITASSKVIVMTVSTIQLVVLTSKRMINQRYLTITALETSFVPMTILVRQILRVSSNRSFTVFARVSEQRLVTFDTEWLLIPKYVSIASQVEVTVEASEHRWVIHVVVAVDDVTSGWN